MIEFISSLHFALKMEAAWTRNVGILPQNYMASQSRRPRFQSAFFS